MLTTYGAIGTRHGAGRSRGTVIGVECMRGEGAWQGEWLVRMIPGERLRISPCLLAKGYING